jgi:hypothetical protein
MAGSYINKYADAAEYAADTARTALGKSTVSLESDSGVLHYDGVNVEVPKKSVKVGDAVYVDGSGNLHFIDTTGTVNNTDLTLLVRLLSGYADSISIALADLDGNGKINNRDAIALIGKIAG